MQSKIDLRKIFHAIFLEYWDDEVCGSGGNGKVFINARTMRVFTRVFGVKLVEDCLHRWEAEGCVKVLGNPNELEPEVPCVQVKNYH